MLLRVGVLPLFAEAFAAIRTPGGAAIGTLIWLLFMFATYIPPVEAGQQKEG